MVKIRSMAERLKIAREVAGYETAAAAIHKFSWKGSTYHAHENGQNNFSEKKAREYALVYGVEIDWLLTGKGLMK